MCNSCRASFVEMRDAGVQVSDALAAVILVALSEPTATDQWLDHHIEMVHQVYNPKAASAHLN